MSTSMTRKLHQTLQSLFFFVFAALIAAAANTAHAQTRSLGIDVSAWQGELSTTTWNTFKRAPNQQVGGIFGDGRDFVFIRASRGGTTGHDRRHDGLTPGDNTFSLSERYDDPYFVQNVNRATTAGMFAGSYHFARPDVAGNTGVDEANHFLQMAGAFMRPGYMLPVFDLEAGNSQHTIASLSNFAVAFSNRINDVMGIRPMIYTNSSYANSEVNSTVRAAMPNLWIARPSAADPLTTEPPPAAGLPNVYGVWNPSYPTIPTPEPWKFWQYDTTGGLNGFAGDIDKDVANGGIEFVKDHLVPALWMNDSSGEWSTLLNWNSGQTPTTPVIPPGEVQPIGTQTLPTPRLPGVNGAGPDVTDGHNDTVILDRPSANITVTHSTGTTNIRKLYAREALNITGGSFTINYVPSPDSTPIAAQFSAAVSLSGTASLSVHTLQVDTSQTFTLGGGSLAFHTINLMPHTATPAKIAVTGDVNVSALSGAGATIANGAGAGSSGHVDLAGGNRNLTVADGAAGDDVSINVPVTNGAITKLGAGTLVLRGANTYAGGTTVSAGKLLASNTTGSGTGAGAVVVLAGGTLGGTGTIVGPVTLTGGSLAPGASAGTLTINNAVVLNSASALVYELSGNNQTIGGTINDHIAGVTNLTLDGTINVFETVAGSFLSAQVGNRWRLINYSGTLTNNGLNLGTVPVLSPGHGYQIDTTIAGRVDLVVAAVPEISAFAAVGLAGFLSFAASLRKRMARVA